MRSNTKASSAGSKLRQAGGLGRIFRGADATRGASRAFRGSSAPKIRRAVPPAAMAERAIGPSAPSLLLLAVAALLGLTVLLAAFAESAKAASPTIVSTGVSAVTDDSAVLEAEVNPEGEQTSVQFEYGTAPCSSNPCATAPSPAADAGNGASPVSILTEVQGLQSSTTYHFRVVATNGSGSATGPDQSFSTYSVEAPASCPNAQFRFGSAAFLPNCRAYEMVTPVDKGGSDIATNCNVACTRTGFHQVSVDGNELTYTSNTSFGDQVSSEYSNQYIASRGPAGWSSRGINAPQGTTIFDPFFDAFQEFEARYDVFTPDLSSGWLRNFNLDPLTPDAQPDMMNLYRRDNQAGSFEALTINAPFGPSDNKMGFSCCEAAEVQGVSEDGSHAVFAARAALTPDAGPGENRQLYDFTNGELQLVSVLPDDTPSTEESNAGSYFDDTFNDRRRGSHRPNAVSSDGSRIFWTSGGVFGGGTIYVRVDGETTIPVSTGSAQYWNASTDGSMALYSEGAHSSGNAQLFTFDVDSETRTPIAGSVRGVAGASDDLSYIYFVSGEAIDGGESGQPNLYVHHDGATTLIATLSSEDVSSTVSIVDPRPIRHASRVTPDGLHIAFQSAKSLTGYDNTDAVNGKAAIEVYRYAAAADQLLCVSCNPSGTRPVGKALQVPFRVMPEPSTLWAAAWLPTEENSAHSSNPLSDDGDFLFFNSFDALLPRDTNGAQDVYEWRAEGVGGCQRTSGCLALISTGESPRRSEFVDASPNGREVFFTTSSSIDPQDPGLIDIYAARIGGGYPHVAPSTPCVGDACQHVPPAPLDATPASANFRGPGSLGQATRERCRQQSRRALRSSRAAQRARRSARRAARSGSTRQARQLRRRAKRLAHQAKQRSGAAKRCRQRATRGAGR